MSYIREFDILSSRDFFPYGRGKNFREFVFSKDFVPSAHFKNINTPEEEYFFQ